MRGHKEIIDQRLNAKVKPAAIFLHDYDLSGGAFFCENNMPSVCIAGDVVESLDLRFVRGCFVHGIALDELRARALFDRILQFKPYACVVCVVKDNELDLDGALWMGSFFEEQGDQDG